LLLSGLFKFLVVFPERVDGGSGLSMASFFHLWNQRRTCDAPFSQRVDVVFNCCFSSSSFYRLYLRILAVMFHIWQPYPFGCNLLRFGALLALLAELALTLVHLCLSSRCGTLVNLCRYLRDVVCFGHELGERAA
jgi:hypothetical protein